MLTNKHSSFSRRLSLSILAAVMVIFIASVLVIAIRSSQIIARDANRAAVVLVDAASDHFESTFRTIESVTENASWIVEEKRADEMYLYHITRRLVSENENVVGSAIAFADKAFQGRHFFSPYSYIDPESGELLSKQLGTDDYDYFAMEWFDVPFTTGKGNWCEPYFDEGGGGRMMSTYSYPVKDADGVYAVITADVTLEWIDEMTDSIHPYEHSFVKIVTPGGMELGNEEGHLSDDIKSKMEAGQSGIDRLRIDGELYMVTYGPLANGWSATVASPYSDVLSESGRLSAIILIIGLTALALICFWCYFAIRKIAQPLTEMSSAARKIADGNFDTPLPELKHEDEISQMRDSFQYMEESLTTYMKNLESSVAANERYESELNIARKIQTGMLPLSFPDNPAIDVYGMARPAREVGGDSFDVFIHKDKAYFTIGDVSGKGVPAAMVMTIITVAFRFITRMGQPLNDVMAHINNALAEHNSAGMFVTMFAGCLDLKTGELSYCNAGHNPVLLNGEFLDVEANLAVGVFGGFDYKLQKLTLERGSRIVLYTDGVTEAERADYSQFGEERLLAWSRSLGGSQTAREETDSLLAEVNTFVCGNEQNDDMTIMTFKYL